MQDWKCGYQLYAKRKQFILKQTEAIHFTRKFVLLVTDIVPSFGHDIYVFVLMHDFWFWYHYKKGPFLGL